MYDQLVEMKNQKNAHNPSWKGGSSMSTPWGSEAPPYYHEGALNHEVHCYKTRAGQFDVAPAPGKNPGVFRPGED